MKFSNDWFARDVQQLWHRNLYGRDIRSYCEIGVCEGQSFAWVVGRLLARNQGHGDDGKRVAWAIDPYDAPRKKMQRKYREYRDQFKSNLRELQAEHKAMTLHWYEEPGVKFLRREVIEDGTLDLAYIDGDHYSRVCTAEMVLAWLKLKVGGIMIVDDLQRRFFHRRPQTGEAVWAFRMAYEGSFDVLFHSRQQIALTKTE